MPRPKTRNTKETPRPREVRREQRFPSSTSNGRRHAGRRAKRTKHHCCGKKNGTRGTEHGQRANQKHATQGNKLENARPQTIHSRRPHTFLLVTEASAKGGTPLKSPPFPSFIYSGRRERTSSGTPASRAITTACASGTRGRCTSSTTASGTTTRIFFLLFRGLFAFRETLCSIKADTFVE